jgi:hypothetical protein
VAHDEGLVGWFSARDVEDGERVAGFFIAFLLPVTECLAEYVALNSRIAECSVSAYGTHAAAFDAQEHTLAEGLAVLDFDAEGGAV